MNYFPASSVRRLIREIGTSGDARHNVCVVCGGLPVWM